MPKQLKDLPECATQEADGISDLEGMSDLEFYKKLEELKRIGVMEVFPDDACCTILERIEDAKLQMRKELHRGERDAAD